MLFRISSRGRPNVWVRSPTRCGASITVQKVTFPNIGYLKAFGFGTLAAQSLGVSGGGVRGTAEQGRAALWGCLVLSFWVEMVSPWAMR